MHPWRRALLAAGAAWLAGSPASGNQAPGLRRGMRLEFPRDHGAHLQTRTEWWYVTGWLRPDIPPDRVADTTTTHTPSHGFQITFFRSRVGAAEMGAAPSGRFTPRHLLFAHAAVTDLAAGRHLHAQRLARWNGEPTSGPMSGPDRAALADADLRLARWTLARDPASPVAASRWTTALRAEGLFALQATMQAPAPPLLQGDAGYSRKGPQEKQASYYYSLPQLDTRLVLEPHGGPRVALRGRAWLDQEWSEELMHPEAVGWDWIGINLFDGSALTAFRLRRADGSALWAGGSFRSGGSRSGAPTRIFDAHEVLFTPGRTWRSAATNALYPMQWQVRTPAGRHTVRALLDAQELDSRGGTGAVYWEGIAELLDDGGRRVGLGYLEMTGYAAPIKLS
jgi:predicted secreted hydrolase